MRFLPRKLSNHFSKHATWIMKNCWRHGSKIPDNFPCRNVPRCYYVVFRYTVYILSCNYHLVSYGNLYFSTFNKSTSFVTVMNCLWEDCLFISGCIKCCFWQPSTTPYDDWTHIWTAIQPEYCKIYAHCRFIHMYFKPWSGTWWIADVVTASGLMVLHQYFTFEIFCEFDITENGF